MARQLDEQAAIDQVNLFSDELAARGQAKCEFCGEAAGLAVYEVPPIADPDIEKCAWACQACRGQLSGDLSIDAEHWRCLQDSAWSQISAVQVTAWRILDRLGSHAWAQELLEQLYLDEPTLEWAEQGKMESVSDEGDATVDSNGTRLADGDSVFIIKDLDVKGVAFVAKRGTIVKNIRLTSNPEHVEGRVNKTAIILKTCFLKKTT